MSTHHTPRTTLILCSLTILTYIGMASVDWRFGTLRDQFVVQTIGWYLVAFAVFVVLIVWAERCDIDMRFVWGTAIVVRLVLLTTTPTLSDDVYRYLWDGHVAVNGVSPYALPIDSAELNYLDTPIRSLANNTWMASPYMPAAQFIFRTTAWLLPLTPLVLQIAMIVFDLGSAFILSKLLAISNYAPHRLILYLLNPLIVVEVAHSAHIDAWMIFLMLLALYKSIEPQRVQGAQRQEREEEKGIATEYRIPITDYLLLITAHWSLPPLLLALATLTKIIPILALPIFFWRWSWKQLFLYGGLTLGLLLPAGLRAGWGLSADLSGTGLFGALRIYAAQWNFNSGIFHWLQDELTRRAVADPLNRAKLIALLGTLIVLGIVWLLARNASTRTLLRLMIVPFAAYLLLTPTVHPWYALIVMTFVPFLAPAVGEKNWLPTLPFLYLSAALIFSYITYRDPPDFREYEWVRQTEWIPTLLLLTTVLLHYAWQQKESLRLRMIE